MSAALISFRGVNKVFPAKAAAGDVVAVKDLSFEVARGEIVAVVGKTGCGKSTMFNLLCGLIEPTTGEVRVEGCDPFSEFDALRGKIAVVFQSDRLLPWRTAVDNVAYGLELLKRPEDERRAIALDWLGRLGLAAYADAYPHALSGGMRQRVSIARAFAVNPDILLCDEPFSALDELTGEKLRGEFLKLVRDTGKTALFITHSISEALALGSRILVFRPPAHIALEAGLRDVQTDSGRAALKQAILEAMTTESATSEAVQ